MIELAMLLAGVLATLRAWEFFRWVIESTLS